MDRNDEIELKVECCCVCLEIMSDITKIFFLGRYRACSKECARVHAIRQEIREFKELFESWDSMSGVGSLVVEKDSEVSR